MPNSAAAVAETTEIKPFVALPGTASSPPATGPSIPAAPAAEATVGQKRLREEDEDGTFPISLPCLPVEFVLAEKMSRCGLG